MARAVAGLCRCWCIVIAALVPLLSCAANSLGCVGTIAGVPLHPAVDGAAAIGADLSGLIAASVDPTQPCNLYISLADRVLLAGCNGTLSRFAGGKPVGPGTSAVASDATLAYPIMAINPSGTVAVQDIPSIRRLDPRRGQLTVVAGNLSAGYGWSPDGTAATAAQVGIIALNFNRHRLWA
jgi:hypothetical protein